MLKCPNCQSDQLYVADSRNHSDDNYLHRRRKCEKCGYRFSTVEICKDHYDELLKEHTRLQATEIVLSRLTHSFQTNLRAQIQQTIRALISRNNPTDTK